MSASLSFTPGRSLLWHFFWLILIAMPIIGALNEWVPQSARLELSIASVNDEMLQVFCDEGDGFSEQLSSKVQLLAREEGWSIVSANLAGSCKKIRFDTGGSEAVLKIRKAELKNQAGLVVDIIPAIIDAEKNQLELVGHANGILIISANGADPYVVLNGDYSVSTKIERPGGVGNALVMLAGFLAIVFLLRYLVVYFSVDQRLYNHFLFSYPVLLSFSLSLLFAISMQQMITGVFINSYPLMSSDSFDYVFEGLALVQLVLGESAEAWPVLRNPVYVMVTAIDHALSCNGRFIVYVQAAALFTILTSIAWVGSRFKHTEFTVAACILAVAFMPLGYLYTHVLGDTLCMALMLLSVCLLLKYFDSEKRSFFIAAFLVALLAGLTQAYGMIPFLGLVFGHFLESLVKRRTSWPAMLAIVLMFTCWAAIQELWSSLIPHEIRPETFALLAFDFKMLEHYKNTWALAILPLLPALCWFLYIGLQGEKKWDCFWLKLIAVILSFVLMTFFYHWPESRFTAVYVPLLFVLLLAVPVDAALKSRLPAVLLVVTGLVYASLGSFVAPASYWQPKLAQLSFSPGKTWVANLIFLKPKDRYQLEQHCSSVEFICEQAVVPSKTPYEETILGRYKNAALLTR